MSLDEKAPEGVVQSLGQVLALLRPHLKAGRGQGLPVRAVRPGKELLRLRRMVGQVELHTGQPEGQLEGVKEEAAVQLSRLLEGEGRAETGLDLARQRRFGHDDQCVFHLLLRRRRHALSP